MKFWENQWSEVTRYGKSPAGISRGDLEGIDGYFAGHLWNDYQRNHNQKALETLLAYNTQHVVNLETLMVLSYNLKLKDTPFLESHQLPLSSYPEIPFRSDLETIQEILETIANQKDKLHRGKGL